MLHFYKSDLQMLKFYLVDFLLAIWFIIHIRPSSLQYFSIGRWNKKLQSILTKWKEKTPPILEEKVFRIFFRLSNIHLKYANSLKKSQEINK